MQYLWHSRVARHFFAFFSRYSWLSIDIKAIYLSLCIQYNAEILREVYPTSATLRGFLLTSHSCILFFVEITSQCHIEN